MNSQNIEPSQAPVIALDNPPPDAAHGLPTNFKANGFWEVQGQKRAGTLRRQGEGPPTAYFIVSHPNGEPPFKELTDAKLEMHDGLIITGRVMKYTNRKDAGEAGICSEYDLDGEMCRQRRFWKTYCRDHTQEKGFEITDDGRLCAGTKGNGEPCAWRAKVNGYCAQHGGGSAPPEKKTFLYEFPIEIIEMGGL